MNTKLKSLLQQLLQSPRRFPVEFALSYDEFLERIITLAAATHYGFTVDDLKGKEGLKEFLGFTR